MRNIMAERINPLLVFGLLAAVGAYILSRTKAGQELTQAAIDVGADVARTVDNVVNGPRGIRNNNPGNIRRSGVVWQGMSPTQTDDQFVQFVSPEWGFRAMARILKNYMAAGYTTVSAIINRWAPPTENVTSAYVSAVAGALGVSPTAPLDASYIPALMEAITQHENGQQPYTSDVIAQGVQLEQTA